MAQMLGPDTPEDSWLRVSAALTLAATLAPDLGLAWLEGHPAALEHLPRRVLLPFLTAQDRRLRVRATALLTGTRWAPTLLPFDGALSDGSEPGDPDDPGATPGAPTVIGPAGLAVPPGWIVRRDGCTAPLPVPAAPGWSRRPVVGLDLESVLDGEAPEPDGSAGVTRRGR